MWPCWAGACHPPGDRVRAGGAHRAGRRALPDRVRCAADEPAGGRALDRRLLLYGAFTAKVLVVHSRQLPGWALPGAGGMLAVIVGVLWYTSALWYYNGYQLPHP
jgi:hypothetical protein